VTLKLKPEYKKEPDMGWSARGMCLAQGKASSKDLRKGQILVFRVFCGSNVATYQYTYQGKGGWRGRQG
jgi:hypothetical protein